MAKWDIKVKFEDNICTTIDFSEEIDEKKIAGFLIKNRLISIEDFDEGIEALFLYKSTDGEIILTDNSGYPYATLIPHVRQTRGAVTNQKQGQNAPHCPTCGSADIERLNFGTKAAAAVMFGFASSTARGQFRCKNCGYKW